MRMRTTLLITALLVATTTSLADATVTLPPPSMPLPASGSFLYVNSEAGDFIGGGREALLVPGPGQRLGGALRLDHFNAFVCCASTESWNVEISAPQGQALVVGSYTGASRFGSVTAPRLDVSGNGHACNAIVGSFDVTEVSFSPLGEITVFDATFEQRCEGLAPALFGRIRVESPAPAPGSAFPPGSLSVPSSGTYLYSIRTNTPVGTYEQLATPADSRFDSHLTQGENLFRANVVQGNFLHSWDIFMGAADGQPLVAGAYPRAAAPPRPGEAFLALSQDGLSCNTVEGSFVVEELTFAATGFFRIFQATFHAYCDGSPYMRHGRIRIELPPPTVLGVTIRDEGNVTNKVGVPLISGTVSCDRSGFVQLQGTLEQVLSNNTTVHGQFGANVDCAARSVPWTLQVFGDGPFNASSALATAGVSCFNCLTTSTSQVVKINDGNLK